VFWLAAATALTWLAALAPAALQFGSEGVAAATVSAAACFIPGCVVVLAAALARSPASSAGAIVGGTLVRLVSALLAAWFMHSWCGFAVTNYLIWIGLFYVVTLVVETALLLQPGQAPSARYTQHPARSA